MIFSHDRSWSQWKKNVASLSDEELLKSTQSCAVGEREAAAWLVAHLAEVFRRDLALKRGYPSVFKYTREELKLSDAMAWERVSAARLALQIPETIERLARGELTLASAGELWKTLRDAQRPAPRTTAIEPPPVQPAFALGAEDSPQPGALPSASLPPLPITSAEKSELLSQILGKSRRESESVLQAWKHERAGGTVAPDKTTQEPPKSRPQSTRKPSRSGEWSELDFHLNDAELAAFDRLRNLLSHKLGTRDPHAVFQWLLNLGLEKVDPVRKQERVELRTQKGAKKREEVAPAPGPTHAAPQRPEQETVQRGGSLESPTRKALPAALRRKVWIRDQGQCQHVDPQSFRKCGATAFLDLDHRLPVAQGGSDHEDNLVLSCASHNRRRPQWAPEEQPMHAI